MLLSKKHFSGDYTKSSTSSNTNTLPDNDKEIPVVTQISTQPIHPHTHSQNKNALLLEVNTA